MEDLEDGNRHSDQEAESNHFCISVWTLDCDENLGLYLDVAVAAAATPHGGNAA